MKTKPHIKPFIQFDSAKGAENLLTAHGFEITALHLDKTKEGWLRLYVTWKASKEEYRFRRPSHVATTFSATERYFSFDFPLQYRTHKNRHPLGFQAGIYHSQNKAIAYSPKFIENIKYGLILWFSPKGWNSGKSDQELFQWNAK
jgi:hypothetical protein